MGICYLLSKERRALRRWCSRWATGRGAGLEGRGEGWRRAGSGGESGRRPHPTHTRQDHWPCDESLQRKCSPGGGPTTVLTHCFLPVYRTGLLYRLLNWYLNYMHCGHVMAVTRRINLISLTFSQLERFVRTVLNTILMIKRGSAIQRFALPVNKHCNCSLPCCQWMWILERMQYNQVSGLKEIYLQNF